MGQKSSSVPKKTSLRESIQGILTSAGLSSTPSASATPSTIPEGNIFVPVQQDNILPQIPIGRHHPVPRTGIEDNEERTLHSNKFYANAFLGNQNQPIWTHPYSVWWSRGDSENGFYGTWGMSITHVEIGDVAYGDGNPGEPAKVYINPRRQSLMLTARELDRETTLTSDTHLPSSVNINLNKGPGKSEPKVTFPLVQGMSFVTAGYRDATPVIQCGGKGFRSIGSPIFVARSTKYIIEDSDGRQWLAYINPVQGINYDATAFKVLDEHNFVGPSGFKGTIQVAKNPLGSEGEKMYDKAAGTFVVEASVTATVDDTKGTYSLNYTKIGKGPLLMFALPHHIESLDPASKPRITNLQLRTTTKGVATAVWAEQLMFVEPSLPTAMGFAPWVPTVGGQRARFTQSTLDLLNAVAIRDLEMAMNEETPSDSMYFAGKTLAKFATILWVMKEILNNNLYVQGLNKLKSEMARYVENKQKYPLFYDDTWKGLVSNAGFTDPGADFGNTYYNDHHFHYGYFVYAAAVIGYLDPEWLKQGDNKAWTNSLVKDFAESDYSGRDFPFSRSFDWFHGHSWAKGLFESADGKDEESTSEDGFASFAIKMWGKVIGDINMEKRGNLMLAIQSRTFNTYFYLQTSNPIHPPRFTPNKVTGILFENKVDHATYFGLDTHLIHGIHMLPLSPASPYLRAKPFVREEWDAFFSEGRAQKVPGGWRGILMANLAIVDPKASYEFFRDGIGGVWEDGWIDGGASRTWYLVFAAGLGGAR